LQPLKTKEFIASIESKAGGEIKRPESLLLQQQQIMQDSLPEGKEKE